MSDQAEPTTSEGYFIDRDLFLRYVEDEVNPARAKEGLTTIDLKCAARCYDIVKTKCYRK